jgi:CRP-like cAMP-binding protein
METSMPITLSAARSTPPSVHGLAPFLAGRSEATIARATLTDHLNDLQAYGARMHYRRNEVVFTQGDAADHVYRILSGTVRLCRYMPDGRRHIIDFLMPGDLMGFVDGPDLPASAEAVSDVTLVAFPRICFDRLAQGSADVRRQLLCHLSASVLAAQQHMFVLGCQKSKERVASFLLRLADRMDLDGGDRMDLAMSRQDIADHLGLTIETVSRSVTALRSEGAILVPNTHQIVLRDMVALRLLAAEE